MKWTISSWQLKQWLLLAFTVCFLSQPLHGFSWTVNEWLGVIEASAGAVVSSAPLDTVPDTVPEGDTCENCNGSGKVGDGTVFVICPVCDGTGKIGSTQEPPAAPAAELF